MTDREKVREALLSVIGTASPSAVLALVDALGLEGMSDDYQVADALLRPAPVEELRESVRLADAYIALSPCDPDIYHDQLEAWQAYEADRKRRAALSAQEGR